MTTQDIEEALVALPSSTMLAVIAEDMRSAGFRDEVIRAVTVVIDHARPMLELCKRSEQLLIYPELGQVWRLWTVALTAVRKVP